MHEEMKREAIDEVEEMKKIEIDNFVLAIDNEDKVNARVETEDTVIRGAFMEALVESFEDQIDDILLAIRAGLASVFAGDLPDQIFSLLDRGLAVDFADESSFDELRLFLVEIDQLNEELEFEGKQPEELTEGPAQLLATLFAVLRCVVGQLITVLQPSMSADTVVDQSTTVATLQSVLAKEVKEEVDSEEEQATVSGDSVMAALATLETKKSPRPRGRPIHPRMDDAKRESLIAQNRPMVVKGQTLSKYLDFTDAKMQMTEVELMLDSCPYCKSAFRGLHGPARSGLVTRHIREVHKDKWPIYAKIQCAARECDYRAINYHSMKCHCYIVHKKQYDAWVESGRFIFPADTMCPLCEADDGVKKEEGEEASSSHRLHDLAEYKTHVEEHHAHDVHRFDALLVCTCGRDFTGTAELFAHWGKEVSCTGTPQLKPPAALLPAHATTSVPKQYIAWLESGRLNLPPGTVCPFCDKGYSQKTRGVKRPMSDLDKYSAHVSERHADQTHQVRPLVACSCGMRFWGATELFTHWERSRCDGTPLLTQAMLPALPRPLPVVTAKRIPIRGILAKGNRNENMRCVDH
ncbi:hypothetical protein PFISCL1PPCAC_13531 [Pristionchus fissidentatus]|uniref:C2H2-type domain-containing protein n=1 Tax=Pristionchus fissidentatus TaxID=1538716 RepID=A0AAV5VRN2_9BILA|nr:hypothetical protein PFISCL1PPCAC_13531 [Pristionchus fissidentatus]